MGLIWSVGTNGPWEEIFIGLLTACALFIVDSLIEDWPNLFLYIQSILRFRKILIRLSVSYLFRIQLDDKYLLIRSDRFPQQFIPVGGVYKRLPQSHTFFAGIKARSDDKIILDSVSRNDLRIRLFGLYIPKFINWFSRGKGRELSPWREFYEELVEPGILSKKVFPYIFYNHVRTHVNGIKYSEHFECYELLIADIFELVPTKDQEKELRILMDKIDDRYIWVDASTIQTLGVIPQKSRKYIISNHSPWIL